MATRKRRKKHAKKRRKSHSKKRRKTTSRKRKAAMPLSVIETHAKKLKRNKRAAAVYRKVLGC